MLWSDKFTCVPLLLIPANLAVVCASHNLRCDPSQKLWMTSKLCSMGSKKHLTTYHIRS